MVGKKYKSKIDILAILFTGNNIDECLEFTNYRDIMVVEQIPYLYSNKFYEYIKLQPNDFIIKDPLQRGFYTMKKDEFLVKFIEEGSDE